MTLCALVAFVSSRFASWQTRHLCCFHDPLEDHVQGQRLQPRVQSVCKQRRLADKLARGTRNSASEGEPANPAVPPRYPLASAKLIAHEPYKKARTKLLAASFLLQSPRSSHVCKCCKPCAKGQLASSGSVPCAT